MALWLRPSVQIPVLQGRKEDGKKGKERGRERKEREKKRRRRMQYKQEEARGLANPLVNHLR